MVRTAVRYLLQNISAEQGRLLSAQHFIFDRLSSLKEEICGPVMAQLYCYQRDLQPFSAMAGWLMFCPPRTWKMLNDS